jgi:hypothetical protein
MIGRLGRQPHPAGDIRQGGVLTRYLGYDTRDRIREYWVGSVKSQFLFDRDRLIAEYASAGGALLRRSVHGDGTDEMSDVGATLGAPAGAIAGAAIPGVGEAGLSEDGARRRPAATMPNAARATWTQCGANERPRHQSPSERPVARRASAGGQDCNPAPASRLLTLGHGQWR